MVPEELKKRPNWVCYTWPGKIPINPHTGYAAKSNDASTWGTYDQAQKLALEKDLAGVGFMFDTELVGIDLDDVVVNGQINDYAKEILRRCNSYAEFSPSKTGIHIIVKGQIPRAIKTPTLEVYSKERYFTVSGDVIRPYTMIRSVDLAWLYPEEAQKIIKPFEQRLADITEGSRNNTFTSLAGTLRTRGFNAEEMFALLKARAKEVGFGETELWSICQSVGRYPTNVVQPTESEGTEEDDSLKNFLKDAEPLRWIIPEIMLEQSITFLCGLPESRKSWVAMDLAISLASGEVWLGKFPAPIKKVVYIEQERIKSLSQDRVKRLMAGKEISSDRLEGNLSVWTGTDFKVNFQPSLARLRRRLEKTRPEVVIIDSFKTLHSSNELSTQDMTVVMEAIKKMRNELGCSFVLVHHEVKGVYQRRKENYDVSMFDAGGTNDLQAAAEHFFNIVSHDSDSSMMHHTKNTAGFKLAPFLIKVVDLKDDKTQVEVRAY